MTANTSKSRFPEFVIAVLLVSSVLFVGAAQCHFRPDTIWLSCLFLLPLAVQLRGLWVLRRDFKEERAQANFSMFYLLTMTLCLTSYCLLWWFYAYWEKKYRWLFNYKYDGMLEAWSSATVWLSIFSGFSLIFVIVLLLMVIRMTRAIIEGKVLNANEESTRTGWSWWNLDYLKTGATNEPFLTLVFFLTVFLGVSYLFGLALAFHDKSRPPSNPALYMSNLRILPTPIPLAGTKISTATTLPQSTPTPVHQPTPEKFVFGFVQGFASMPFDDHAFGMTSSTSAGATCEGNEPDYSMKGDAKTKTVAEWRQNWRSNCNDNQKKLKDLIDRIITLTQDQQRIHISVVGYSDKSAIGGAMYQSNYELAEARAHNTKHLIHEILTTRSSDNEWWNIDWAVQSLSNELPGSEKQVKVSLERGLDDSSAMLLKGQRPNSLNLMDYVYFANYTITTTGYGDIVPNTAYAKFICSFTNICEVFFLVVFFNVLLSLRRSEKDSQFRFTEIYRFAQRLKARVDKNARASIKRLIQDNNSTHTILTGDDLKKLVEEREAERRATLLRIEKLETEKMDRKELKTTVREAVSESVSDMTVGQHVQSIWGRIFK